MCVYICTSIYLSIYILEPLFWIWLKNLHVWLADIFWLFQIPFSSSVLFFSNFFFKKLYWFTEEFSMFSFSVCIYGVQLYSNCTVSQLYSIKFLKVELYLKNWLNSYSEVVACSFLKWHVTCTCLLFLTVSSWY